MTAPEVKGEANFAPKNAEGLSPYVITKRCWGRTWQRIEYARTLKDAKAKFGWTRELYTTVAVRRARVDDLPATPADRSVQS